MKKNETPEQRQKRLDYMKAWREAKKAEDPNYHSKNYEKYKDKAIAWSKANSWRQKELYSEYYDYSSNKERYREYHKKWRESDKGKRYAVYWSAKRRAQQRLATSEQYLDQIKEIYNSCPDGYHVDHIVPLNGENICGLHVPWNLQYLTKEENLSKGNKFKSNS